MEDAVKISRLVFLFVLPLWLAAQDKSQSPGTFAPYAVEPVDKHPEWDSEYSRLIRDATTGTQFMTDLVDHLPASSGVPSPLKFNGYIAGAPGHLTYAADVHRYMRALAGASPRVKVFSIGRSEEGREMVAVAIGDEAAIGALDEYKAVTARLADPRKTTEQQARDLIGRGKPVYYLTGAMHSPETGSPEMLMELAYRLAVEETPFVQSIRKNVITLITPVLEVDGRERVVDAARWRDKNARTLPLAYWGRYVGHDNNRDTIGLGLAMTRNILRTQLEWHPQVMHDLHESIPFLYISTGTGPYNAWLDPLMVDEWQRMAYHEVQVLTSKGLPGVWTQGFFDGWAPSYLFYVAMGHNSIGRFYETFGNLLPSTEDRVVREWSQRTYYRPNPPLPSVRWSLRNNVNYQQSGVLLALSDMAQRREHFLAQFWNLGKRSIAKARTEGPAAYVLDGSQKRQGQLRDLMLLLRQHGVEIHVADKPFALKPGWPPPKPETTKASDQSGKEAKTAAAEAKADKKPAPPEQKDEALNFAAGSFIVRMDQPYSRFADLLFDTQYVRGEERLYDDSGWTVGYARNLEVKRIVNQDILAVPMRLWDGAPQPRPVTLDGAAIALDNTADTDLVRFRYALPKVRFLVAEEEIKGKKSHPVGTLLVPLDSTNRQEIGAVLSALSLTVDVLESLPAVKTHVMGLPRIALLHTWSGTQEEGWYRLALESLKVPYDYISTQTVAREPRLRAKYDVILFPPADGAEPQDIVNGLPPGSPLPWKKTELTPNLGVDETDDMRPGLGLEGVSNLRRFVEAGGLLITVQDTAKWAIEFGFARWVKPFESRNLKVHGSLLQTVVKDGSSPVAWGYDERVPVYMGEGPIFWVGIEPPRRADSRRPTGRGSKDDPDVPQGRPFVETPARPEPGPGEEGFQLSEDYAILLEPYLPKMSDRPRVILAFPKESDTILLSGMLESADEITGKAVVVDSPLGDGHVLLFGNNPMWRMTTQGSYSLLTNAILNYDHLSMGWPPKPPLALAQTPTDLSVDVTARVAELDSFHEIIYQIWHDAWPKKDAAMLRKLAPDVEKGIANVAAARLPGILREKKPAWESNVRRLQAIGADYKAAAAADDDVRLLDAAEKLHSQFEALARVTRPALKEIDEFHSVLYLLYHYYMPEFRLDKIKTSAAELKQKMAALNNARLPERLKRKEAEFAAARTKLARSVDALEAGLASGSQKDIRSLLESLHADYESLTRVFE
jgi:hypothetical protein